MSNENPGKEALADEIFPITTYEAPMPSQVKRRFQPWHRPRKQYVRHHQWCHEVKKLVKAKAPTEGVLKYLGLPGDDLLDLRYFHSAICEPYGVKLRFLGFNRGANPKSPRQIDLNISLDEVKRLNRIDPQSEVLGDDFTRVANQKSIAFERTCAHGPYDIINLDLCDGFGAKEPGELDDSYYTAVSSLLSLQARNANPWLMFLTTRADKANVNANLLQKLIDKYCCNLEQHSAFKDASRQHFAIETSEAVTQAIGQPDGLLHVFLTGLCKWFVALALEHQPPTSVEVLSVFGYRVNKGAACEDLVSLAIKFTPTFNLVSDPVGLAAQPNTSPSEGSMATKALGRVATRIDADLKLSQDTVLFQSMTEATVCLLEPARYDVDEYRAWAAAG
jgi:hypothetical protein